MRIVLIGVSHWHTPFYSTPVLKMKDATIVGVSDPDAARAAPLAAQAKCPVFADYREMCAKLKPDFAFVLGRHIDMADEARFLIDSRIPFSIEKPCALNATEAHDIARRAATPTSSPQCRWWCATARSSPPFVKSPQTNKFNTCHSNSSAAWSIAIISKTCNG